MHDFLFFPLEIKGLSLDNKYSRIPPARIKDAEHNFLGAAMFNPPLGSEKQFVFWLFGNSPSRQVQDQASLPLYLLLDTAATKY